jgi:hypothetical protein
MVTFELDYTQFLVAADITEEAINYAIKANETLGGFVENDENGLTFAEVRDPKLYSVADVDFDILKEIIQRKDWLLCKELNEPVIIYTN